MINDQIEWVILGINESGDVFDVPSWSERLCGMLSKNGIGNRQHFSEYLTPAYIGGLPAVIVSAKLSKDDPETCTMVKKFVAENRLKTRPGRNNSATSKPPTRKHERRESAAPDLNQARREFIKG